MKFQDPADLERYLDEKSIRFHKVGVVDIDGVLRGKIIDRQKLGSALRKGFGFCDVVLGWDSSDQLYDNTELSGWHTGYRDAQVELDLSSVRKLAGEEGTLFVHGQFAGEHAAICPRALLGRVIQHANKLGFFPRAAFEYEFFVFDETPHSAREKGYRNLKPFTPGMFGYSMLRGSVHADLHRELVEQMEAMEIPLEGLHTETGPGVLEAAIRHDEIKAAADKAALFKTYTKVLLQRRGLMGTFMAKWSNEYPGQSGHLHLSLQNKDGINAFYDEEDSDKLSPTFRSFVAGQVQLLPQVLPMVCSTVNAYRRLVPGLWAPTHSNWGIENRTTAIRAIPAGPQGTRSEYRIGPADANPYLVAAAALATGLYGIEHNLAVDPVVGNAYEKPGEQAPPLPNNLPDATRSFIQSKIANELFGETFVRHFAATRDWEAREFQKHVSDFDLQRYFEII